jgi:hypothetical protein
MATHVLDLSAAPEDSIERIMWLSGAREQALAELDRAFSEAYFNARLEGRLDAAVAAGPFARKRVLAFTRHENERRGRTVKWGDAADPVSR